MLLNNALYVVEITPYIVDVELSRLLSRVVSVAVELSRLFSLAEMVL